MYAVVCPFSEGIYYPRAQFGLTGFLRIYMKNSSTAVRQFQMNIYFELHLYEHELLSVQHVFQCNLDAIQAWHMCQLFSVKCIQSVVLVIGTR